MNRHHTDWPIEDVLYLFGWDGSGRRRGHWTDLRCPFHEDRTASAAISRALNIFRCMACDVKGNSVTLVMARQGFSAKDAVEWLDRNIGSSAPGQAVLQPDVGASWNSRHA